MHRNSALANFVENVLNVENLNTKIASQLLYLTSKSLLTQFLKMQIISVCPVEIQPVCAVIENCQEYYFAKLKPSSSWTEL